MAEEYKSVHTGPEIDAAVTRANSNPNPKLLHNWYFLNLVNQRGATTFVNGYGPDRWFNPRTSAAQYTTVGSNSIQFTVPNGRCLQKVDHFQTLIGKTVTLSALYKSDDSSDHQRFEVYADGVLSLTSSMNKSESMTLAKHTFVVPAATESIAVGCAVSSNFDGTLCEMYAINLDLGSEQTLAHQENGEWVLNEIPDYAETLAKCRNYYRIFNAWARFEADYIDTNRVIFSIPATMRANPVVGGNFKVYTGFTEQSGFAFAAYDNGNNIVVVATKENHGLTSAWLGVSADLGTLDANL